MGASWEDACLIVFVICVASGVARRIAFGLVVWVGLGCCCVVLPFVLRLGGRVWLCLWFVWCCAWYCVWVLRIRLCSVILFGLLFGLRLVLCVLPTLQWNCLGCSWCCLCDRVVYWCCGASGVTSGVMFGWFGGRSFCVVLGFVWCCFAVVSHLELCSELSLVLFLGGWRVVVGCFCFCCV